MTDLLSKIGELRQQLTDTSRLLEDRAKTDIAFFDWNISFSDVFANGGFDIVIGNPPYGLINKKQNQENGIVVPPEILEVYRTKEIYLPAQGGMLNIYRLFVVQGTLILKQNGVFCEIFPLAFTCDLSASKLRRFILNQCKIIGIEAFPERDDPKKRVFASAKMSVCILRLYNIPDPEQQFYLRINKRPYVEQYIKPSFFTISQIRDIDSLNFTIPLTNEKDTEILKHIYSKSVAFSTIGNCKTGEIDMTFCKPAFSLNESDAPMLRGVHVDRYLLRKDISQGETYYVNTSKLLAIKNISSELFHSVRVVMQGITGVNEKNRLKMTITQNTYCANSVNYCTFENIEQAKYYLAIFNSKLSNYVFKLLSTNSNVNGYEIDNLPIVSQPNGKVFQQIIDAVNNILKEKNANINADTTKQELMIDDMVYDLYGLTEEEKEIIRNS